MTRARLRQTPPDRFPIVHNLEHIAYRWLFSARLHQPEPVLEVTAFGPDKQPVFRVFTDRKGRYSQRLPDGGWGTSKICTLLRRCGKAYADIPQGFFIPSKAARVINGFLSAIGEKAPDREMLSLERLARLHDKQGHEKNAEAKERRRAALDEERSRILSGQPPLPPGFVRFISERVLPPDDYLFYRNTRGRCEGYCVRCGTDVTISVKMRHNEAGDCPACGASVIFKSAGLPKQCLNRCGEAAILQRGGTKDELYLRLFYVAWDYEEYRGLEPVVMPMGVTYFNRQTGKCATYRQKWASNWQGRFQRKEWELDKTWTNKRGPYVYNERDRLAKQINLYIEEDVKTSHFKNVLAVCKGYMDVVRRLSVFCKYPALEYILASGYRRLANEITFNVFKGNHPPPDFPVNLRAKTLTDLFGCGKQEIRALAAYDPGHMQLRIYRKIKEKGYKTDSEVLGLLFGIREYQMRVLDALEYASPRKILGYIQRQYLRSPEEYAALENVLQTWTDYLYEAQQLNYDLADDMYLFPKKLLEFHRKTSRYVEYLTDEVKDKQLRRIGEENNYLRYENDVFLIRPVAGMKELIGEGKTLRNCAGGYTDNVLRGECLIMVVREKNHPHKPFYTVEYRPEANSIRQCYGMRHARETDEVRGFLDEWLERLEFETAA